MENLEKKYLQKTLLSLEKKLKDIILLLYVFFTREYRKWLKKEKIKQLKVVKNIC